MKSGLPGRLSACRRQPETPACTNSIRTRSSVERLPFEWILDIICERVSLSTVSIVLAWLGAAHWRLQPMLLLPRGRPRRMARRPLLNLELDDRLHQRLAQERGNSISDHTVFPP